MEHNTDNFDHKTRYYHLLPSANFDKFLRYLNLHSSQNQLKQTLQ